MFLIYSRFNRIEKLFFSCGKQDDLDEWLLWKAKPTSGVNFLTEANIKYLF